MYFQFPAGSFFYHTKKYFFHKRNFSYKPFLRHFFRLTCTKGSATGCIRFEQSGTYHEHIPFAHRKNGTKISAPFAGGIKQAPARKAKNSVPEPLYNYCVLQLFQRPASTDFRRRRDITTATISATNITASAA